MKTKILLIAAATMMLFCFNSQAQSRQIIIDMHDQVFRGQQSVLHLKQLIKRQHPGMNLNNFNLMNVKLVAKSKHGRGQARLIVGQWSSRSQNIGGRPVDWSWDQPRSFDRIDFHNRIRQDDGKRWQIHMDGNIKVRKLLIVVERERRAGHTIDVYCGSTRHRYIECRQNAPILRAQLISRHSNASCREGRDWGYRGRNLWVNNGCKGTFRLRMGR